MENMNILLIAVICFFVFSVALGLMRGFIKNLSVLASSILTLILVSSILNPAIGFVQSHTDIEGMIAKKCYEKMVSLLPAEAEQAMEMAAKYRQASQLSEEEVEALNDDQRQEYEMAMAMADQLGAYEMTTLEQASIIESVDLPQILKDKLTENNNDSIYSELGVDNFVDYVCHYVGHVFMRMIIFVLLFVLITIFLRVIILSMEKIRFSMPLLRGIDSILGGFTGVGVALVMVWVFFVIMTLCCTQNWGQMCFEYLNDSKFLTMLYEKDNLINLLARLG